MKIAVVEDCLEHRQLMKELILKEVGEEVIEVKTFYASEDFMASSESFDLIFLDISMQTVSGYDLAKLIRSEDQEVMIVFVTSSIEYAVDGYSLDIDDFILKPIDPVKVKKVMKKALKKKREEAIIPYVIKNKGQVITLNLNDILYIESRKRVLYVKTLDGTYEHYKNMQEEEDFLKPYHILRSHRSYLVNMAQIHQVKYTDIELKNGETIPLSARRHKDFMDLYTDYIAGDI